MLIVITHDRPDHIRWMRTCNAHHIPPNYYYYRYTFRLVNAHAVIWSARLLKRSFFVPAQIMSARLSFTDPSTDKKQILLSGNICLNGARKACDGAQSIKVDFCGFFESIAEATDGKLIENSEWNRQKYTCNVEHKRKANKIEFENYLFYILWNVCDSKVQFWSKRLMP